MSTVQYNIKRLDLNDVTRLISGKGHEDILFMRDVLRDVGHRNALNAMEVQY